MNHENSPVNFYVESWIKFFFLISFIFIFTFGALLKLYGLNPRLYHKEISNPGLIMYSVPSIIFTVLVVLLTIKIFPIDMKGKTNKAKSSGVLLIFLIAFINSPIVLTSIAEYLELSAGIVIITILCIDTLVLWKTPILEKNKIDKGN